MSGGHDAIVEDATGPAYGGAGGATRIERFQVLGDDGSYRSMPLCRVVNALTDPRLAERARAGTLHRLPDGRELAMAYVYHDPEARKLALVVPPQLAHEALAQRAWLMNELASEHSVSIPDYVLEAPVVLGTEGLEDFLEPPPEVDGAELREADPEDLDLRARHLQQREQDLAEQERGLIAMGEELTAREGALQRARTELEAEVAAHEEREQQLLSQLESLRHQAQVVPNEVPASEWQEVGAVREVAGAPGSGDATVVTSVTAQIATSERPRPNPPPLRSSGSSQSIPAVARPTPPPLHRAPGAHHSAGPPPLRPSGFEHGDVHSMPPPLPGNGRTSSAAPPPVQLPVRAPRQTRTTRSAEVDPPEDFTDLPGGWMAMRTAHEELWLFAHVSEAQADAFLRASDLLLQCVVHDGYPVVILTLVAGSGSEQHVLRLPLDGLDPARTAIIETLGQSFRVRVALYNGGAYLSTLTVATLREGVARAVLDFLQAEAPFSPNVDAEAAMDAVMASPPPIDSEDLPFGPARRQANSLVTVRAAVEQLASWMRPSKRQEATLIYSVPTHVVEGSARRVLRAAKLFGVALPQSLVEVAVDYNVVDDPLSLVAEQIEAFHARLQAGDHLGQAGTRENFDRLFAQAEAAGMQVTDALRERADIALDQLAAAEPDDEETGEESVLQERPSADDPYDHDRDPESGPPASDAPPMSSAEVKALLLDPRRRLWAIGELGQRGVPALVDPVFDAIDEIPVAELPQAVAAALSFGELAADRLQRGLDAESAAMRHVCALGLGTLQLRRSLAPLLQRLDTESTNVWVEIARAIGGFGSGALRSVVRSLPSAAHPERLMVVLAHLANHGAAAEVEKLENSDDAQIKEVARKAMARRSRLEWEDLAIREQRTLTDNHPAARFSQSFFSALRKLDN